MQEQDQVRAAVHLLVEIAGEAQDHVRMTRGGYAKYYTVFQPLVVDVDPALKAGCRLSLREIDTSRPHKTSR